MRKDVLDRIEQRLQAVGLSPAAAGKRAGLSQDAIRNWKRAVADGGEFGASITSLEALAPVLDTTVAWLIGDESAPQSTAAQPAILPPRAAMPADVPVMGTAAGAYLSGAFQLEPGAVDYVRRPPALASARDVYALFVEGESMAPLHRPGDLIFVHPHKPPRIGDSVIVQTKDGPGANVAATIGLFRKRTERDVVISKLNPAAEVAIKRQTVLAMHKVLTMAELFGV